MASAAYCREQAEACRALAKQTPWTQDCARLLAMAQEWDHLADAHEDEVRRTSQQIEQDGSDGAIRAERRP
jgi:hypothetical protein